MSLFAICSTAVVLVNNGMRLAVLLGPILHISPRQSLCFRLLADLLTSTLCVSSLVANEQVRVKLDSTRQRTGVNAITIVLDVNNAAIHAEYIATATGCIQLLESNLC
jgi:hypothetical protein